MFSFVRALRSAVLRLILPSGGRSGQRERGRLRIALAAQLRGVCASATFAARHRKNVLISLLLRNPMVELSAVQRVEHLAGDEFIAGYKKPARPVMIEGLTRQWPAREKWTLDYFKSVVGEKVVPLYDSKPAKDRKHQHAPAAWMPFKDYLDRLTAGENNLRMFFFNILAEAPALTKDFSYPALELKFFKKLPVLFVGGKGAKVQMHFDIDLADIVLCHFGGKKRVMLFSPEQTQYLYRVPFSFSSLFEVKIDQPDYARFPALAHVKGEVAELNHGDVLYIPPGYWHYVIYEEIGFSMSLRAFPRDPRNLAKMLYNILFLRSVEGVMRKLVGQRWNDRNERLARELTHRRLGIPEALA
jgi:hypothetical protein